MPGQLSFLVIICFSSVIILLSLDLRGSKEPLGLAFFVPWYLCIISFSTSLIPLTLIFFLSDLLLGIYLLMFLMLSSFISKSRVWAFVATLAPLILLPFFKISDASISSFLIGSSWVVSALLILASIGVLVFKDGRKERVFITGLLSFLAAVVTGPDVFVGSMFRLVAFILFTAYFYVQAYNSLLLRAVSAEKKLAKLEDSIDQEIKKRTQNIERSNQNLLLISKTDSLTKSYNKAAIISIMEDHIYSRIRFSILLFDIDNFKSINDNLGHIVGDSILIQTVQTARSCIRGIDFVGRYGGDEFIIVLPGTSSSEAMVIAERFREKIEKIENQKCTISIGISSFPQDAPTVEGLINAADSALYSSKRKGRNTVSQSYLGPNS